MLQEYSITDGINRILIFRATPAMDTDNAPSRSSVNGSPFRGNKINTTVTVTKIGTNVGVGYRITQGKGPLQLYYQSVPA